MRAHKLITDRVALKVEINVSTVQALCMINVQSTAGVMALYNAILILELSFATSTASTGARIDKWQDWLSSKAL